MNSRRISVAHGQDASGRNRKGSGIPVKEERVKRGGTVLYEFPSADGFWLVVVDGECHSAVWGKRDVPNDTAGAGCGEYPLTRVTHFLDDNVATSVGEDKTAIGQKG